MTDETVVENALEGQQDGTESPQTPERDYLAEAKAQGYREDFEGPEKLDPKEFVLRKPLYDEMKKLRKKTKELETAIRTQTQMQEQLLARERQEALELLKSQKITAIEEGDARKVVEIEAEVDRIKSTPIQTAQQPSPEFLEWSSDKANEWYSLDEDMQAWADAYGLRLFNKNQNRPLSEIYMEISRKVKEVFPHKFGNQKRNIPAPVDSSDSRTPGGKTELGETDIPKEYKQVFHTMWRSGAWGDITMKEASKKYATDLAKIGAI